MAVGVADVCVVVQRSNHGTLGFSGFGLTKERANWSPEQIQRHAEEIIREDDRRSAVCMKRGEMDNPRL